MRSRLRLASAVVIRRIIVAVDGTEDLALVDHACALADRHHARLELVNGIPSTWMPATFGPCPVVLADEIERGCRMLLAEARERVPADLPVCTRHVRGCARRILRKAELLDGDVLVLRARPLPRWRPAWAVGRRRRASAAARAQQWEHPLPVQA